MVAIYLEFEPHNIKLQQMTPCARRVKLCPLPLFSVLLHSTFNAVKSMEANSDDSRGVNILVT